MVAGGRSLASPAPKHGQRCLSTAADQIRDLFRNRIGDGHLRESVPDALGDFNQTGPHQRLCELGILGQFLEISQRDFLGEQG